MLYTLSTGSGLHDKHFFFDSTVSYFCRHFYSILAFSSAQSRRLCVYIIIHTPSAWLKIFVATCPSYLAPPFSSVTLRSPRDCSLLHRAWCEYHLEPRKDTRPPVEIHNIDAKPKTIRRLPLGNALGVPLLLYRRNARTIIYRKGKLVFYPNYAAVAPQAYVFFFLFVTPKLKSYSVKNYVGPKTRRFFKRNPLESFFFFFIASVRTYLGIRLSIIYYI